MKIVSIQVGMPRSVPYRNGQVSTGIFKSAVAGPVRVNFLNLAGDGQADLRVHGGVDKAVYAYSLDAYDWWRKERPTLNFSTAAFGENLSVDAFAEDQVFVGDTFEIGTAVLQAVQPRFPCFKLGIKFNDPSILRTFLQSGRPGVYFRVLQEGEIAPGDDFKLIAQDPVRVSIARLFSLPREPELDRAEITEILGNKALAQELRAQLEGALKE